VSRLRALVVDDEPLARQGLAEYVESEGDIEVVQQCADGVEAVDAIRRLDPDLVFLDIQMPELSGFEVIEAVGIDAMPPVIFVTAYDEFALQAFDAFALDYVLKPLDPERVARAVERARRFVAGTREAGGAGGTGAADSSEPDRMARLTRLLEHVADGPRLRRFAVRDDGRVRFVHVDDVAWMEADGNYVVLHADGEAHRVRTTMTALETQLDPDHFIRIHRSAFARVDRIRELEPLHQGDYVVVLDDGTRLTSSRSCRENLRALVDGVR
jgi:two-component system LytT family response regulator